MALPPSTLMDQAVRAATERLGALGADRVQPALVADVSVAMHGGRHPLRALCSIAVRSGRELVLTPFDPGSRAAIQRALDERDLGGGVRIEGDRVVFALADPSDERRAKLEAEARQTAEAARIQLRRIRTEAMQRLARDVKAGKLVVAQQRSRGKQLQARCDEACAAVDAALTRALDSLR